MRRLHFAKATTMLLVLWTGRGLLVLGNDTSAEAAELPESLKPGVRVGKGVLEKTLFFEDKRLGWPDGIFVGDWIPEHVGGEVAAASSDGVAFVSKDGELLDYVDFRKKKWYQEGSLTQMEAFDANGDGTCEFFTGADLVDYACLVDRKGDLIWGTKTCLPDPNAATHGDLNQDGHHEFCMHNGEDFVMVDHKGKLLWKNKAPVEHRMWFCNLYFVDLQGDSTPEIAAVDSERLLVFDVNGKLLSEKLIKGSEITLENSRLVHHPDENGSLYFWGGAKKKNLSFAALVNLNADSIFRTFDVPAMIDPCTTAVKFKGGEAPFFVICGWIGMPGPSGERYEFTANILNVLDQSGKVVYCEYFGEDVGKCVAAVSGERQDEEFLLVGGKGPNYEGRVWRYRMAPTN
ncbi:MAG: hypothetical protein HY706_06030 [Candidatus Hydrogenedentes bacterium]|nr:hypothetical protein [Candidatus Hydrogenedentota bacterium]